MSRISLPAYDGLIADEPVQWWYWTGHLSTAAGRRFGFEVVFFVGEALRDTVGGVLAEAAITDLEAGRFVDVQHEAIGLPTRMPSRYALAAGAGAITAAGGDGRDRVHATIDGYTLDLTLAARRPPVLHYGGEVHRYGFGGYSGYYAREAMTAAGTLRLPDGTVADVDGSAWFDRQFGLLLWAVLRGWQWFAIQLDDDTQIMLFAFRQDESEWMGSVTGPDGTTRALTQGDFTVDVLDWWTSPRTNIRYPSGWRLDVLGRVYTVTPLLADQELSGGFFWFGPRYWEGACAVTGAGTGRAYVELVGFPYAAAPSA